MRQNVGICVLWLCGAAITGCYRYTATQTPVARMEVRLRFSAARDLLSESTAGKMMPLHSVRELQAILEAVRGDTIVVVAPGTFTGRDGTFLIDRGTRIAVVRDADVMIETATRYYVQPVLTTLVTGLTVTVVYLWAQRRFPAP